MTTATDSPDPSSPSTSSADGATSAAGWTISGVPLAPLGNEHVVGVATGQLLDAAQRGSVLEALDGSWPALPEPTAPDEAAMAGQLLPDTIAQWLVPLLGQAVSLANNQHFRFELTGVLAHDPTMAVRIETDEVDVRDRLFSDLQPASSTRKLTVVLPVSEGTGGVPEFPALGKVATDAAGEVSIFPSYLSYRLAPVIGEPRVVLWARVHGPHFQ